MKGLNAGILYATSISLSLSDNAFVSGSRNCCLKYLAV